MYSKELKACSQTDFYTPIVHGNIVHKSQSVEATHMSTCEWKDEQKYGTNVQWEIIQP
jgi:hypothetical protein